MDAFDIRDYERFPEKVPLLIGYCLEELHHKGRLLNFSRCGMCFESDAAFEQQQQLLISIEAAGRDNRRKIYQAVVRWCHKTAAPDTSHDYTVGVVYHTAGYGFTKCISGAIRTAAEAKTAYLEIDPRPREHPRRPLRRSVRFVSADRLHSGSIDNISRGGIYIKAKQTLRPGQRLDLIIPALVNNKFYKLSGRVLRCDPYGIAVRFNPVIEHLSKREKNQNTFPKTPPKAQKHSLHHRRSDN